MLFSSMSAPVPPAPAATEYAAALGLAAEALNAPAPPVDAAEDEVVAAVGAYLAAAHLAPVPFPSIAMEILELVRFPDVDLNELARYVRVDGALAGGVLALANSAVYRSVRRIDTVKDAVARLGISEVARLAAAISMKSVYSEDATRSHERFRPLWTQLFLHAVTVARCASELARQKVAATAGSEQTFMAGLLHDVGLASVLRGAAELTIFGKLPEVDPGVIRRVLFRLHVEAGTELHASWRLPPSLAEVATHHHEPGAAGEPSPQLHLVRMVSALDLLRRAPGMHPRALAEVVESARELRVPPSRVKTMPADLDTAEAWVATVFPA